MIKAQKIDFDKLNTCKLSEYDSTKLNLGNQMGVFTGPTLFDNYTGPLKIGLTRASEIVTIPISTVHINTLDDRYDEVYMIQTVSSAATTCILALFIFDKETSEYSYKGGLNLTMGPSNVYNVRNFEVHSNYYTEGTISCNGTSLTGVGTFWQDDRLCAGSRIGFGSTNPNEITEWYEIESINSNTGITLTSDAGIISSSTPYVIHDLRVTFAQHNSTLVSNSGLVVVKGLRPELFQINRTVIPLATTIDNIRAVYRIYIAGITTGNVIASGTSEPFSGWKSQKYYINTAIGTGGSSRTIIYVLDFRDNLILSSGISTQLLLSTSNPFVLNSIQSGQTLVYATLNHGPTKGIPCLFFSATNRLYSVEIRKIKENSDDFLGGSYILNPPGSTVTYSITTISNFEYDDVLDQFILMCGSKSIITKFSTNGEQSPICFGADDRQLDSLNSDSEAIPHLSIPNYVYRVKNGFLHVTRPFAATNLGQLYALPYNSHQEWAFDTNSYLVTPKVELNDATKLYYITPIFFQKLGSETFSIQTESFRIFYRTNGIDNNTGKWGRLNDLGELNEIFTKEIQFAFTFKILGTFCIPARLKGFIITYEDNSTNDNYVPSLENNSIENRIFAWYQTKKWEFQNIPNLIITVSDIKTKQIVIKDTTNLARVGVWEYSENDGVNWNTWDTTKNQVGNLIRYTADTLPNGKNIKVILNRE
jgi:hypothetical protein